MRLLATTILLLTSCADNASVEEIINLDEEIRIPAAPLLKKATTLEFVCEDGSTSYSCASTSSVCYEESPVYCDFSVDLVKSIMRDHDMEISTLSKKLESLEKQHTTARSQTVQLRERIQKELHRASQRVFLMEPRLLKGHYLATDNAIILIALCASFGVTAGLLGGALLFNGS